MDGTYSRSWETILQQQSNKSNTRLIMYKGETHHARAWLRLLGLLYRADGGKVGGEHAS